MARLVLHLIPVNGLPLLAVKDGVIIDETKIQTSRMANRMARASLSLRRGKAILAIILAGMVPVHILPAKLALRAILALPMG